MAGVRELPVDQRGDRRAFEQEIAGADVAVDQHGRPVATERCAMQPVERVRQHWFGVRDVLSIQLAPEADVLAQRLTHGVGCRVAKHCARVDGNLVQQRELPEQIVLQRRRLAGIRDAEEIGGALDLLHEHGRVRRAEAEDLRHTHLRRRERTHDRHFTLQREDRARERPGARVDAQECLAHARRRVEGKRATQARCAAADTFAGGDLGAELRGDPCEKLW